MSSIYVPSPVRTGKKWLKTATRDQAERRSMIPVRHCPDCRHEYQTQDGTCPYCAEAVEAEEDLVFDRGRLN